MAADRWRAVRRRPRPADLVLSVCLMLLALLLGWLAYAGLRQPSVRSDDVSVSSTTQVEAPPDASEAAVYIDEHFTGADWYPSIVGYEPLGSDGIAVLTSLDRSGSEQAVAICRALSFWRPGDDLVIIVHAADETPLAETRREVGAADCRARDKEAE